MTDGDQLRIANLQSNLHNTTLTNTTPKNSRTAKCSYKCYNVKVAHGDPKSPPMLKTFISSFVADVFL